MVYMRFDDRVTLHEKILAAGADAFALWVGMIAHCNRSITEGVVPKAFLSSYFPPLQGKPLHRAVRRLIEVGLLVETDEKSWLLHDYEFHQGHAMKSAVREREAKELDRREDDRDRQRAHRARRKAEKEQQLNLGYPTDVTNRHTVTSADVTRDSHGASRSIPQGVTGDKVVCPQTPSPNLNQNLNLSERERRESAPLPPSFEIEQGLEPGGLEELFDESMTPTPREYVGPPSQPAPSDPLEMVGPVDGEPARSHPDYAEVNSVHRALCEGFRKRWEGPLGMGMPWTGTLGVPAHAQAYWFVRASRELKLPVEEMLETALDAWFADPWVKKHRYPWKNATRYLSDAFIKAHRANQAAEANNAARYVEDLGAFGGVS